MRDLSDPPGASAIRGQLESLPVPAFATYCIAAVRLLVGVCPLARPLATVILWSTLKRRAQATSTEN